MPTLFDQHKSKWANCTHCPLCEGRTKVVLGRGSLPCDVLLIGEAPGDSEDILGQPFVGPAGKLLDKIILDSFPGHTVLNENGWVDEKRFDESWRCDLRYALTNLVACFPKEQKKSGDHQPPDEAILACAPRLDEFVSMADPQLIVCVGSLARDWLDPKRIVRIKGKPLYSFVSSIPMINITHPAAILRMNMAQQGLAIQRCEVLLANAVKEFCCA